jgi:hypothetical protein
MLIKFNPTLSRVNYVDRDRGQTNFSKFFVSCQLCCKRGPPVLAVGHHRYGMAHVSLRAPSHRFRRYKNDFINPFINLFLLWAAA